MGFQAAVIIRTGNEPLRNISADEPHKALSRGWLQHFPAPSILRYDEDGFLRSWDKIPWLETFGMKLEPIAAESAWQGGKHSKHLQTLKEQLNLLCMEIGDSFGLEQLLALAVSAKNNMHNIRGYSPNQWAFGQEYSRIPSFLENTNNLPHQAARSQPTFEEQVQAEYKARKLFLQVDAQKRNSKALHAKSRPLGNFAWGNWFTISERVPKEGSR